MTAIQAVEVTRDDVLHTLEEIGPFKTLVQICAEIAQKKGVSVDQIDPEVVRDHLENDLEKISSLIDKSGEGAQKKWKIHFLK